MKIDFYYWDNQCPINYETIALLSKLDKALFNVNLYDITEKPHLAKRMKMFFPTLTVFDDSMRWRSPIREDLIFNIKDRSYEKEKPYIVKMPEAEYKGRLERLNASNIEGVSGCCTMTKCVKACILKGEFLTKINGDFLGYLHYRDNKLVGGAEYVPSIVVPYDIPRDKETAFLTCSYLSSDSNYDNKVYPLGALEKDLANNYKRIIAISDEEGVFPNGNLEWFQKKGYKDEGLISIEEDYARLHLVSKVL